MLATIAIVVTITAFGLLASPTPQSGLVGGGGNGMPLTEDLVLGNPAVVASAAEITSISGTSSMLDTLSYIMSSEWLIQPAFAANVIAPANQTVTEGDEVTITFTSDASYYLWHQSPSADIVDLGLPGNNEQLTVTFMAPNVTETTVIKITLIGVTPDPQAQDFMILTILDSAGNADLDGLTISPGMLSPSFSSSDTAYTASVDNSVTEVTLTPAASHGSATITVNNSTVTSGTGYTVDNLDVGANTITVTVIAQDATTTKTYTVTLTRAAPPTSSNADLDGLTISPGMLSPSFSSSDTAYTASVDNSVTEVTLTPAASHGSATITVNNSTVTSGTGYAVTGLTVGANTLTVTVTVTTQDDMITKTYIITVTVRDAENVPPQPIRDASQKRSSSSSIAPIVDLDTLTNARIMDIPPHIAEQVASHDDSDPLELLMLDDTFDFPLVINNYGYLLDDVTNTLVPQIVTVGDDDPTVITFTVYTQKDLAHFTLYLNLSDENTGYTNSDTYITYGDDGTTVVTDPHGYIGDDTTITVTQEDDSMPEKKTVSITIEFGEEPMGLTNMVAYMWNTDRKAAFIKIVDALEVVASPEPEVQTADPEPAIPDSELPVDSDPRSELSADPEPVSTDTLGTDDYDEVQVLNIIRMWSGFEPEMITDEQMLASLGLDDDYPDADIPDWMMTELGALAAKGDVTVEEFVLALQYVLEHT